MLAQAITPEPSAASRKDLQELRELADLHSRGKLNDAEFEAGKRALLAKWLA